MTTTLVMPARPLVLASCLVLAACADQPAPAPDSAARAEPEPAPAKAEPEPEPAELPPELRSPEIEPASEQVPNHSPLPGGNAPGPIYLVINTKGVVALDEDGAKLISGVPERNISDMFVGPKGAVYLLDAEALHKVEGEALVEVERFSFDDVAPVDNLVIAADESLWVTSKRRVGHRIDGEWSFTPFAEIGAEQGFEVEVGDLGLMWLVGPRGALYLDEAEARWTPAAPGLWGGVPTMRYPTSSPAGTVHTAADFKLVRLHKEIIDGVLLDPKKELHYSAGLSLASDGDAGLISPRCDLIRVTARPPTKMWRFEGDKYACQTPEAVALDGSERFWVASREGLSLITDKRQVREYPAGSFEAVAGRVSHMVAIGHGPAEPPIVGRIRATKLEGKLLYGKKPAANAAMELCPSVRLDGEGTPCSAAKTKYTTTTDATGAFSFEAVAIGDYSFAAEIDGEWRWSTPPTFAAKLEPGAAHDVGSISLPKN